MEATTHTRVYIVDDSDSVRQRLIAMLETMGNVDVVGVARTAAEAIDGIAATSPDVVLLDLNLRAGSGIEVLNAVRRNRPGLHVVVLTNHAEPQYRRACMKAGARHFLDKSTQFECVKTVLSAQAGEPTGTQP